MKLTSVIKKDVVARPLKGMLSRFDGKAAGTAALASVVMAVVSMLTFLIGGTTR